MEPGNSSEEKPVAKQPLQVHDNGPPTTIQHRHRWHDEDDEDGNYFMSEPSVSEADSSEYYVRQRHNISSLLSPRETTPSPETTNEDLLFAQTTDNNKPQSPPPPPPASPGTSISSWDSPHLFRKHVQLYFGPDKKLEVPRDAGDSCKLPPSSNNSTSSDGASTRRKASAEFLQQLKAKSIGALKDARPEDFDSDSNIMNGADRDKVDAVIRMNRLDAHHRSTDMTRVKSLDETLVMDLSISEDETTNVQEPLDWEAKHSADDEKTTERPRRARRGGGVPGHRRRKSGDAAAASLMTGGTDWKGMQIDQLPIPTLLEEHDDESEQHVEEKQRGVRKSASFGQDSPGRNDSRTSGDAEDGFAVGAATKNGRASKRQRKTQRIRRPFPLERGVSDSTLEDERLSRDVFSRYAIDSPNSVPAYVHRASPTSEKSLSTMEHVGSDSSGQGSKPPRRRSSSDADIQFPSREPRAHPDAHVLQQPHLGDRRFSEITFDSLGNTSNFSWLTNTYRSVSSRHALSNRNQQHMYPQGQYQYEDGIQVETVDSSSEYSGSDKDLEDDDDDEERDIMANRLRYGPDIHGLDEAERLLENKDYRGEAQHILRRRSTFAKSAASSFGSRASYRPTTSHGVGEYPTFVCPVCKTRQREFFTASTAPVQYQGPAGYLALYFAIYVIASLFIFGLEEGWQALDCVYFAVITLTTAGLGDFVPTSDGAKVLCSIFIYFGVACIGLLLGSYLASMLDEKSYKEAEKNRVENCTNCARIKNIKKMQMSRQKVAQTTHRPPPPHSAVQPPRGFMSERDSHDLSHLGPHVVDQREEKRSKHSPRTDRSPKQPDGSPKPKPFNIRPKSPGNPSSSPAANASSSPSDSNVRTRSFESKQDGTDSRGGSNRDLGVIDSYGQSMNGMMSPEATPQMPPGSPGHPFGSPMTTQILGRQSHTRHMSFDIGSMDLAPPDRTGRFRPRKYSADIPRADAIPEDTPYDRRSPQSWAAKNRVEESQSETESDDESSTGSETSSTESDFVSDTVAARRIKTAKYVFLTLKQALMNSVLIIAIGGLGFFAIEGMSAVDSFYFTTVLLTTVGYGDIVPVTAAGKLFATVYILVAGTILLHNMSLISMIPLELRRRRIERAVLTQFGDQLDDATLRELATGPLVRNLQLSSHSTTGLEECTREMFALAMLVRLGKVTETDIKETFAAFRRLDVDDDGYLSSKSIIAGMLQKRRATQTRPPTHPPPPPPLLQPTHVLPPPIMQPTQPATYWFGKTGSLHVKSGDDSYRFADPAERVPEDSEHSSLLMSSIGYDSFGSERQHPYGRPDVEHGYPGVYQQGEPRQFV